MKVGALDQEQNQRAPQWTQIKDSSSGTATRKPAGLAAYDTASGFQHISKAETGKLMHHGN